MSLQTGIVKGRQVAKNRDGGRDVLLLQVELSDPDDVQTVELMQSAGDQCNPENGSKVLVISNGSAYKIAIAVDDLTLVAIEVGERAIRAVLDGSVKSSVLCKVDGNVVFNEGTDFAVQFTALKVAFDLLVVNFNAHFHVPSGPTPTVPSVANIDASKVAKVRL
jgi:hypothetical protein